MSRQLKAVFPALILAALVISFAVLSPSATAGTVRVFLVGGQSNAEGHASVSGLPSELSSPQTDVDLYYYHRNSSSSVPKNQVVDLQTGASNITSWFGPELTFGSDMADYYADDPDSSVAIIKYALGGTGLVNSHWAPGGICYTEFNSTVNSGLTALQAAHPGDDVEVTGMIWMQGEQDLQSGEAVIAAYPAALTSFISDMRTRYAENMPFVIGQLSNNQSYFSNHAVLADRLVTFKAGQASVAAVDPMTGLVVTDGPTFTMNENEQYVVHFDTQGQTSLGSGFATEMQSLLATDVPEPSSVALLLTLALAGFAAFRRQSLQR